MGSAFNGKGASVWEDKVQEMDCGGGGGGAMTCMHLMPQNCTLNTVNITLCILYHN